MTDATLVVQALLSRPDAERQAVTEHQVMTGRRAQDVLRRGRGRPAKAKDEA
jgi:hypothetical protein